MAKARLRLPSQEISHMEVETASRLPEQLTIDDGIDHTPDGLYQSQGEADWIQGFNNVTDTAIARFHECGYLVIHDGFDPREVQDAIDGLVDLIAGRHPDYRGVVYEAGARALLSTTPPEQRQDLVRKLWQIVDY